jgi:methyl-accepting chemotaxis protein
MSHGVFGGIFSQRSTVNPPIPVIIPATAQPADDTAIDRSFEFALDALPRNVMFCDRDLTLRYLNRCSIKTLQSLQEYLPVPVDQIVGNSIHIFHKSPATIDKIMGAKQNHGMHQLPHTASIMVGPAKLDLMVEPMTNEQGEFIGAVVLWGVSTQMAMEKLRQTQEAQHNDIEHLNGNLQRVATATHQIETSIAEIARNASEVSQASESARAASEESKKSIANLRVSSAGVAKVAELIASIATQTSVLALNANIEAGRAGVHGRGFAVVASEVRKLAEQTASATAEIQSEVAVIRSDISTAMSAIEHIAKQTEDLTGLSCQMAAAAEEQHLATQEMAHNLERAAHRTSEIANVSIDNKTVQ